jgi:hypothetical protein
VPHKGSQPTVHALSKQAFQKQKEFKSKRQKGHFNSFPFQKNTFDGLLEVAAAGL